MKRLLQFIALLLPFFYMVNVYSGSSQKDLAKYLPHEQKIYILPGQLELNSEGIFVNCENQWFETDSLFADEKGIFIQNLWPQEDGCRKGYVPCRNCQQCVNIHYDICPHCNRPV